MAASGAALEHPPHQPPRAGRDNDLARRCHRLQPRRQVWRLADRNALGRIAGPQLLADDNQPGGDADARLKGHVGTRLQRADRVQDRKAGAHGLLRVMLIGRRVAKIDQHAIAEILGDKSIEARHHIVDRLVESRDQIAHVLGVETCRESHRIDDVARHDRELSSLGAARSGRHRRRCRVDPRCGGLGVDRLLGVASQIGEGKHRRRSIRLCRRAIVRLCIRRSPATSDLVCRIGLRVQLVPEQCNEILVVLERLGLASRGGQRLNDQADEHPRACC